MKAASRGRAAVLGGTQLPLLNGWVRPGPGRGCGAVPLGGAVRKQKVVVPARTARGSGRARVVPDCGANRGCVE